MKVIIDRFEENYAVVELEDGSFATISRTLLPQAAEGDVIIIEIDRNETQKRKKKIHQLMDDLFKD